MSTETVTLPARAQQLSAHEDQEGEDDNSNRLSTEGRDYEYHTALVVIGQWGDFDDTPTIKQHLTAFERGILYLQEQEKNREAERRAKARQWESKHASSLHNLELPTGSKDFKVLYTPPKSSYIQNSEIIPSGWEEDAINTATMFPLLEEEIQQTKEDIAGNPYEDFETEYPVFTKKQKEAVDEMEKLLAAVIKQPEYALSVSSSSAQSAPPRDSYVGPVGYTPASTSRAPDDRTGQL